MAQLKLNQTKKTKRLSLAAVKLKHCSHKQMQISFPPNVSGMLHFPSDLLFSIKFWKVFFSGQSQPSIISLNTINSGTVGRKVQSF